MAIHDDDFAARVKRVQVQPRRDPAMPIGRRGGDDGLDEKRFSKAVLLPQLAFVLGALALIGGRSVSMNTLMIEPSTELLGGAEGGIILFLLVGIGMLIGKSEYVSHCALVIGASLAFLGESFYIPLASDLMSSVYTPYYVDLVFLNSR